MTIKIDSNLQDMIISAVRYALGRKTYITGQTVDYIIKNPALVDKRVKKVLLKDIEEYFRGRKDGIYIDDDIDYASWQKLYNWLKGINR